MPSALGNTAVTHIANLYHGAYSFGGSKKIWRLVEIRVIKSDEISEVHFQV